MVTTVITYSNISVLKDLFLNIGYDDIFTNNAYNFNRINIFNIIWRLIRKKPSITNIDKVEDILKKIISEEKYNNTDKNLYVTAANYNTGLPVYAHNKEYSYNDFLDLVIASASIPVMFKPIKYNNEYYFDGGVFNNLPLQKAIDEKCDEIDIIILKPEDFSEKEWKPTSMMSVLDKSFNVILRTQLNLQLQIALNNIDYDVKLNFYYDNVETDILSLDNMSGIWDSGYNYIKDLTKTKIKNSKQLKDNIENNKNFSIKLKKGKIIYDK